MLGPSDVLADATPDALADESGLSVIVYEDVTGEFEAMCAALVSARSRLETRLREVEGDEIYEEEREKKKQCRPASVRVSCADAFWWP